MMSTLMEQNRNVTILMKILALVAPEMSKIAGIENFVKCLHFHEKQPQNSW